MIRCKWCGGHAINPDLHGRQEGVDLELGDTRYWRKRAEELADENRHLKDAVCELMSDCANCHRRKDVRRLADALENLMAQQNGPPLSAPRHADAWQKAMDEGRKLLKEMEGGIDESEIGRGINGKQRSDECV